MGRLVESLAADYHFEIAGCVDRRRAERPWEWPAAGGASGFSRAEAGRANFSRLAGRGTAVVVGTTGWQEHEPELRAIAARHGIGVVAAPNFALGVNLFAALAARA